MSDNDEIRRKINAIIAKKMEFVDFGYMEFIYSKLPYIPYFHYLVAKDETCFMAINLELQLLTLLKKLLTTEKKTRFLRLK